MLITLQSEKDRLRRICNHEAGHYVLAREYGFKTGGITVALNLTNGHKGESAIEPWTPGIRTFGELETYLENRIKVLFAGVVSEAMDSNRVYDNNYAVNEWNAGGAVFDHAKIKQLVHVLRNIKFPNTIDVTIAQNELSDLDLSLLQKTAEVVDIRFDLIRGIGEMLFQKVHHYNIVYSLSETEINQLPDMRSLYP